jgi:hypothetical protein
MVQNGGNVIQSGNNPGKSVGTNHPNGRGILPGNLANRISGKLYFH